MPDSNGNRVWISAGSEGTNGKRPDRKGTKLLAAHVDEDAFYDFKVMLAERRMSLTAAMHVMMADEFRKDGRPVPPQLERDCEQFKRAGRRTRRK